MRMPLNSSTTIQKFRCIDEQSGQLPLPLQFGDPPARQVPLFIKWEAYSEYLPPRRSGEAARSLLDAAVADLACIQMAACLLHAVTPAAFCNTLMFDTTAPSFLVFLHPTALPPEGFLSPPPPLTLRAAEGFC